MDEEYFIELKKTAPKLMDAFCKIYGYTEYKNEYYCNYLINATKPKKGFISIIQRIEKLQNIYDANLEPFKLNIFNVIGHLESNKYRFISEFNIDKNYVMKIYKNSAFIGITKPAMFTEYLHQAASIIAAKHLEETL